MTAFADLEARMADAVHARLANAHVTPDVGAAFDAMLRVADRLAYDTVTAGDYTLRYRTASATLAPHDPVTIGGVRYVVAGLPERINAHESVAPLMREAD